MRKDFRSGVTILLAFGVLSCDSPTGVAGAGTRVDWVSAPPATMREGAAATISVELHDAGGRALSTMDGATVTLSFAYATDSLPGFSCANDCATILARGRATLEVGWLSAGDWNATACVRPAAPADSACVKAPVRVLPVHAALTVFPADSIGRLVRFPVEARLRLPDGSAVVDLARPVRLRFNSDASDVGHLQCPEAGPLCERIAADGVVRLDSVAVLDMEATTLSACVVAPNGHERCDPAGPRKFGTFMAPVALEFVGDPTDALVGVPFETRPTVVAREPDGSRRSSFTGLVSLALGAGAELGPVLAGTGVDAATMRGVVTVRAVDGVASFADVRILVTSDACSLVATADAAVPDTSARFAVTLDASRFTLTKFAGDSQYGLVSAPLPVAPQVRVTGPLGDFLAGVLVEFQVGIDGDALTGGGRFASDTTDSTGVASAGPWTMSPDVVSDAEPFRLLTLTAAVRESGSVSFSAMAVVPWRITFVSPPSDIVVGDTMRPAVVVEVRDFAERRVTAYTDSIVVRSSWWPRPLSIGDPTPDFSNHLLGTLTRAAIGGRATFDDLTTAVADSLAFRAAAQSDTGWWFSGDPNRLVAPLVAGSGFVAFPRITTARVIRAGGDARSALIGAVTDSAPIARVEDEFGNGIAGRTVTFTVTTGGGSVTDSVQVTDADGLARLGSWTLGASPGPNTVTATADGIADPVVFTATAVAETIPFDQLAFIVAPSDLVAGGIMLPPVVVELQDALGRRAFGATDSIYVSARLGGGGYLLGTTVRAAVDGRATFDDLSLTRAGTFTFHAQNALAAVPGTREVSANFVVRPAAPAWMLMVAGVSESGTAGRDIGVVPTVRVEDVYSNPVPDVAVSFAATIGSGTVTDPDQVTDADGLARPTAWTLGVTPGYNALTAYSAGIDSVAVLAYAAAPTFDANVVSAGYDFTCAVARTTDLPYCWGENTYGQLGDGTQTARNRPTLIGGGLLAFTQISAGLRFACGLGTNGAAFCWGDNSFSQLGSGNADPSFTPVSVLGGHVFSQIDVGASHACALDTDGVAWCWGTDGWGQLGNGISPSSDQSQPVQVNTLLRFTQITVGDFHSCGISQAGQAWCWGYNVDGRVGDSTSTSYLYSPALVAGGLTFTHLSAGSAHTCGVAAGSVYCWGRNNEGQLGTGATSTTPSRSPVNALGALGTSMRVTAGGSQSCAVNSAGETYCWGANTHGQLGDASTTPRTTGSLVAGGNLFVAITAGQNQTCGVRSSGATYCWGWNAYGQLGYGSFTVLNVSTPTAVVEP